MSFIEPRARGTLQEALQRRRGYWLAMQDESQEVAEDYVRYALASGLTPADIAYSLGYTAMLYPTEHQVTELVAFKWRMLGLPRSSP